MKNSTIPHAARNGLIARLAIQCTCPDTGETGSFLYSGETWRNKDSRVTPVYNDLYELFNSIPKLGWSQVGYGYDSGYLYSDKGQAIENHMATNYSSSI